MAVSEKLESGKLVWRVEVERERNAQIWHKMADAMRATRGEVRAAASSCLLTRAVCSVVICEGGRRKR